LKFIGITAVKNETKSDEAKKEDTGFNLTALRGQVDRIRELGKDAGLSIDPSTLTSQDAVDALTKKLEDFGEVPISLRTVVDDMKSTLADAQKAYDTQKAVEINNENKEAMEAATKTAEATLNTARAELEKAAGELKAAEAASD
jgi:hypothetical protein